MSVSEVTPRATLTVEVLGVEMSKQTGAGCSSCDETRNRLVEALAAAQPLFDMVGVEAKIVDRWIGSEHEARAERVSASPTIRIGSVEVKPQHVDNTEKGRIWQWQGKDYTQPPVGLFLDLLMKGYAQSQSADSLDAAAISPYLKLFNDRNTAQAARDCCGSNCCQ